MRLFLALCVSALADPVAVVIEQPVDAEELCYFDWLQSVTAVLAADPLAAETCEPWDPATAYDPALSTCAYWCGSTFHFSTVVSP